LLSGGERRHCERRLFVERRLGSANARSASVAAPGLGSQQDTIDGSARPLGTPAMAPTTKTHGHFANITGDMIAVRATAKVRAGTLGQKAGAPTLLTR
jgi:hypothetical protein